MDQFEEALALPPGFVAFGQNEGSSHLDVVRTNVRKKDFTLINVHISDQGEIARTDLMIPFSRIDHYRNQLPDDKDAKIVVYCMMGPTGRIAAEKLVGLGYRQVIHLQGGMMAWQNAGKTIVIRFN